MKSLDRTLDIKRKMEGKLNKTPKVLRNKRNSSKMQEALKFEELKKVTITSKLQSSLGQAPSNLVSFR